MNKVLKYGVVGALGVLGGVAVSKAIRKVVKTVTKDEPEEVTMMVEETASPERLAGATAAPSPVTSCSAE